MRRLTTSAVALLVLLPLGACNNPPAAEVRPGNPDTYARLEGLTSCEELDRELGTFLDVRDAAAPGSERATVALAYAKAADERMRSLGCAR